MKLSIMWRELKRVQDELEADSPVTYPKPDFWRDAVYLGKTDV